MPRVTMPQVLAWRMRRQFLDGAGTAATAEQVAGRLCGVQAQVASCAALAVAVRTGRPAAEAIDRALREERTLVRMWAARGTLHLLTPEDAALQCGLLGETRTWQRAAWLRNFGVTEADMTAVLEGIAELLHGRVLTREELVTGLVDRTGSAHLTEALRSGWGALLKPAAYSGLLCNGPPDGNRVTYTSPATWLPGWRPVPAEEAGPEVVRRYLAAYGPATGQDVLNWLRRGITASAWKSWAAALGDELATVEVDGGTGTTAGARPTRGTSGAGRAARTGGTGGDGRTEQAYVLAEHLDELVATAPIDGVRMLGGFDQYVIAVNRSLIPAAHLAKVSRTAGWISPVVLHRGRIAGVWNLDGAGELTVELFERVSRRALTAEARRLTALLGMTATLTVGP